jgi:hypothetical protein
MNLHPISTGFVLRLRKKDYGTAIVTVVEPLLVNFRPQRCHKQAG